MHHLASALLFLLLLARPACASNYSARVGGVSDGDTLTVLTAEKKQIKIRLAGIDAPESGQDFGSRSPRTWRSARRSRSSPGRRIDTAGPWPR